MRRLIEKGLMFGNLFHVDSPVLVERYNRALHHLTGKRTALTDFHIDISGFAPEIGAELGDELYLNHKGVNRQFILLSTEQRRAPLLNAQFSTSRGILRRFIDENEAQLFALTAQDAVAGELVNSVFDVSAPARLFDIRKIKIEADTTSGILRHADDLAAKVNRFKAEEDAWFDDVLIADMITLAGKAGDVTRNPVRLKLSAFEQENFWTAHFGGLYVFRNTERSAVLSVNDPETLGALPVEDVIGLSDRNRLARFFEENALVEPIVKARGLDGAAVLRQKLDFIIIDTVAGAGLDLSGLSRSDMRRLARQNADRLPAEYHALAQLLAWAESGGDWPRIRSDHPAYFYTLRAADHADADLVNMALSELTTLDFRQLFICNKPLFYRLYAGWPEAKKTYVASFLDREYQIDKAGARAALFGHEPDMDNSLPLPEPDLLARVGPWGAVRRH